MVPANHYLALGAALFGAVAQMRYTEPVATLDADVLIDLPPHAVLVNELIGLEERPMRRPRVCRFCVEKTKPIN